MNELLQFNAPDDRPYFLQVNRDLDHYHIQAAIDGVFDQIPRLIWKLLDPGDTFFDLGANIGTISIPMAVKGATVHAFEILLANTAALRAAATATGVDVNIHQVAVWSSDGEVTVGGTSAWGKVLEGAPDRIPAIALDGFVRSRQIEKIDVIKIDIEGSELAALEGMRKLLAKWHPDIVIEFNVHCIDGRYSYNDMILLLEGYGYRFYRIRQNTLSPFARNGYQETVSCDYLASIKPQADLEKGTGIKIAEVSEEEEINWIVREDRRQNVHKLYAYAVMDRARPGVRNEPRIRELMRKWELLATADPAGLQRLRAGAVPR
jgi:FkbM family methyltransferase